MILKKILLLGSFLIALSIGAQEKKYAFSLQEAISFALENSYTTQNANKEVAKALKQKWETAAVGLPQIDGEVSYQDQIRQRITLLPVSAFDNTQNTINTVERFFDGATRNNTPVPNASGFIPVRFGTTQQASANATLTQLIFDGSYLVGLQAASSFIAFANTQKEKQDLLVIEGVTNSYGAVLLTQESIKVLENNIATLTKNLNEIQKIFENGLAEEESVEQLQITLLQVKNQLNNTKRVDKLSLQMLKLSLGIPLEQELSLTDSLETIAVQKMTTDTVFKEFDITKNNDYKLSELLIDQRRLENKLEKSRLLPSLGAFLNGSVDSFDNEFNFLKTSQPWFSSLTWGATLRVPIFSSGLSGARIKRTKLAYEQAQISHKENTQRIQLSYQDAKSNFEFAIDNLKALEQNLKLAERIENKNQIKFNEGLSSSFELRQAQTQLYAAQQEYLQAQLKVIQNNAKLQSILNIYNP